jgi:flavin reductase (DIM6/NTAB) family NADH-FMN oxidoreductase RutF
MDVDTATLGDDLYRTMTSLVVPRPIGWLSTVDADGHDNLAPFSYFNAVSARPPVVVASIGERDGRPKDTARFAPETGEFFANLDTEDVLAAMDATSADVPGSEFDGVGIDRAPAETVAPPRVADAAACLGCTVVESLHIGRQTIIFGEVQQFYVDDDLLTDGKVDVRKIDAVGRLGGPYYTGLDLLEYTRQH